MSRRRLRHPELIHSDFLINEMDAVTAADVLGRQKEGEVFRDRFRVPVVSGQWATGDAPRSLMDALVDLGHLVDETELGDLSEDTSAGAAPTVAINTNAGNTATATLQAGDDTDFTVRVTVPVGATGFAIGTIFTVTFAVERPNTVYAVHVSPASSDARALGGFVGRSARAVDTVSIGAAVLLQANKTYDWDIMIRQQEY